MLEFLIGLKEKLISYGQIEKAKLLQLKEAEKKALEHSFDGKLNAWDFRLDTFFPSPFNY